MASDKKYDMHVIEECECCIMWKEQVAAAREAVQMAVVVARKMEARLILTATCTEEKFSWEPPVGPDQALTRVALIRGTRTVETGLNLSNFRSGDIPSLVDVDFTIPGPMLLQRMLKLGNETTTYMTVCTGVAPALM